jgi:hypothetical protein
LDIKNNNNKCKIFLEILVIDVTPRLKNEKKRKRGKKILGGNASILCVMKN